MKFTLEVVEEHPDGSATAKVDMDQEGLTFLVNLGLVTALKEAIANHKEIEPYEQDHNEVSGC
jgi:hypothetical protein